MLKFVKIIVFIILAVTFALIAQMGIKTTCARLPNGMNIGYQALIDLSTPYSKPDIVPKYENGASLLPGDAWPFLQQRQLFMDWPRGKITMAIFGLPGERIRGLSSKRTTQCNTIKLYPKQANYLSIQNMVYSVLMSS